MNRKVKRMINALKRGGKASRIETEIRNEYLQECARAGELQYKLGEMQKALVELNNKIRTLNLEYTHILETKKETASEEATEKSGDAPAA